MAELRSALRFCLFSLSVIHASRFHVAKCILIQKETGKIKELISGFWINRKDQNKVLLRVIELKPLLSEQINEKAKEENRDSSLEQKRIKSLKGGVRNDE